MRPVQQVALSALFCAVAAAALAQPAPAEQQAPKPPAPRESPLPAVAQLGPAREIKLAPDTWFRFGAQVQAWFKAAQDRIRQLDGSDGSYAYDFYCPPSPFFPTPPPTNTLTFNSL